MKATSAPALLVLPTLLVITSCSPVPDPTARGAAHYRVQKCLSAYGGIGATVDAGNGTGLPDLPNTNPSDFTSGWVVDGQLAPNSGVPYEISCTVTGTSNILIEGELKGPNVSPATTEPGTQTNIAISGSLDAATGEGIGQVSFYTATSGTATPFLNEFCTLSATPTPLHACSDAGCTGQGRMPEETGNFYVQFECTDVRVGNTGVEDAGCVTNGTIAMDRCAVR